MAGELMSGSEVLFTYGNYPTRVEMRRRRAAMTETMAYEVWEDFTPTHTFLSPKEATRVFVERVQELMGEKEI